MIHKILTQQELTTRPPVLIDIGASGKIHDSWKKIAKYSVCLAFDADQRDFFIESEKSGYRKLIKVNKIVSTKGGMQDFYLTRSPHCSSLLKPRMSSLADWIYCEYFDIEKILSLDSTTISKALEDANLDYIDWFKSDSQGTDLRIFKSLDRKLQKKVLIAEFEPGIIDAYEKEDKVYSILQYMDQDFFVDEIIVKGTHRIRKDIAKKNLNCIELRCLNCLSKKSACWVEISFINNISNKEILTKRDYLLLSAICILRQQYTYCIEICEVGLKKYGDNIFQEIKSFCIYKIRQNLIFNFPCIFYRSILKMKSLLFKRIKG